MEKKQTFADTFEQQLIAISKAGAYDALAPQVKELQEQNTQLKAENERLREALQIALVDLEYEREQIEESSGLVEDKESSRPFSRSITAIQNAISKYNTTDK